MNKKIFLFAALLAIFSILSGCASIKSLSGGASPSSGESPSASTAVSASADAAGKTTGAAEATEAGMPFASPSPEASPVSVTGVVPVSATQFEYKSQYIETNVSLPAVTGLTDSAAQDKINTVFKDFMASVKSDNTSYEAESKKLLEDGAASPAPYMIDISYSVPYNKGGLLCILVSDYRYLGGAHGGDTWYPYLFDVKSGRQLYLGDLMEKDSGYRKYINGIISKEIKKRAASDELMELADFKDIGDKPWVYLTSEGFVFYFQEYEYFPYAAGIQQFFVPYGDVSKMLKPEYASLKITPAELKAGDKNNLTVGDIGQIVLDGNPTTGYMWTYEIVDSSILELSSQDYASDAKGDVAGAGGKYSWEFRALKPGKTTVIFTYARYASDLAENASAEPADTVQFTITVK